MTRSKKVDVELDEVQKIITQHVQGICEDNLADVLAIGHRAELKKVGLSFTVTIDLSEAVPDVQTIGKWGEAFTDRRRNQVEDPAQEKIEEIDTAARGYKPKGKKKGKDTTETDVED